MKKISRKNLQAIQEIVQDRTGHSPEKAAHRVSSQKDGAFRQLPVVLCGFMRFRLWKVFRPERGQGGVCGSLSGGRQI